MKIRLFTNEVAGGWHASDLDRFLGGSEECIVLISEAFVRAGYDVFVYHTFPATCDSDYMINGVKYARRENIHINEGDILITFKDNLPWLAKETDPIVKIYWSCECGIPWDTSLIDAFVCISDFHASRSVFVPQSKKVVIPLGVDLDSLDKNAEPVELDTMLYCSSPDRGLMQLLSDWPIISAVHKLKLKVAYGFGNLKKMGGPSASMMINNYMQKMKQSGIEFLGALTKDELEKEYHKAKYWIMPLNKAESELFCLNAVKSRYCGCIPIVNKIGALHDTVADYIPYKAFKDGNTGICEEKASYPIRNWDSIVENHWIPLFESIINK